jgi:asparagine synthase (glutamine-hydrolysing)
MCGIAGFVGEGDRADLVAMTNRLAHRGPDGQGFFIDDDAAVFLGHRRLAILDLEGGEQPMWNEDGQVGIVFNGEIYNHAEMRRDLELKGHRFRSDHSDTEVLVHGYEEWGESLPERLNGMFAFAILDRPRRRLFLARDRFGEKPLYYARGPKLFAFASELAAVACHRGVNSQPSLLAMQKLFAYGYIPAPHALYEGSSKLPGGHHLTLEIDSGMIRVKSYWTFRIEAEESLEDTAEPRLVEELACLLSRAVERRLISDVPLGIFLSGGIDSSAAVAFAAQRIPPYRVKTFTLGFTEPSFDESSYARQVAEAIGTDHKEKQLEFDAARDMIFRVLMRLDEPLGDASILPTYVLSAFAREHVTVALSGEGGDELFAGYDPFQALGPAQLYQRLVPRKLHRGLQRLAQLLPVSGRNMSFDFKLRRVLCGLSYPTSVWNPVWMAPVEPRAMAELFDTPVRAEDLFSEAIALWDAGAAKNVIDRTLEFFTRFYLQDDVLAKVDRAAMMASLESRAVFLDNDLVDFCRRLPHRFKIRGSERKYLLKRALSRHLPKAILTRRKKGFGIPLATWLRFLPDKPLRPIVGLNTGLIASWRAEHRAGKADHRLALWTSLALQHGMAGDPTAEISGAA